MFNSYPVRRQVIVNTKSDRSFRGILWHKGREFLILRGAEMLRGRDVPLAMDGELVIYRENVDFIQVV